MYANLGSSYQWNLMNDNNAITNRISELLKIGTEVTVEDMVSAFTTIKNRIKSPLYPQLMEFLTTGRIRMVFCESIKVPLYLPFVVLQPNKGNFAGVVFLNHCECTKGESEYMVNERMLKVSLESCYMTIRMMEMDMLHNVKLVSPSIIRPATKIYIHTVAECINRKYSIKLDQTVYNQILFMTSRYFIGTVLGYNPDAETMENYCLYNCKNADLASIRTVNDKFDPEDFKNIGTFLTKLTHIPELQGRIGKLNVNAFMQMYVNLYNAPMTLSLEVFSYLVYNIMSVLQSTYVNNYHMLKNIVGDDGSKLYGYLVTILGD